MTILEWEDPLEIKKDIMKGLKNYHKPFIFDRQEAIRGFYLLESKKRFCFNYLEKDMRIFKKLKEKILFQ